MRGEQREFLAVGQKNSEFAHSWRQKPLMVRETSAIFSQTNPRWGAHDRHTAAGA
jgi:hypothetical protein